MVKESQQNARKVRKAPKVRYFKLRQRRRRRNAKTQATDNTVSDAQEMGVGVNVGDLLQVVQGPEQEDQLSLVKNLCLDLNEPAQMNFFESKKHLFQNVDDLVVRIQGVDFFSQKERCMPPECIRAFLRQVKRLTLFAKVSEHGCFAPSAAWFRSSDCLSYVKIDTQKRYLNIEASVFPSTVKHLKICCSARPFCFTPPSLQTFELDSLHAELHTRVPCVNLRVPKSVSIRSMTIQPFATVRCTVLVDKRDPSKDVVVELVNGPHVSTVYKEKAEVKLFREGELFM